MKGYNSPLESIMSIQLDRAANWIRLAPLLLLGAIACISTSTADRPMVEAYTYYDDGVRILLSPDDSDGGHCAGADVNWVGHDLHVILVRTAAGEEAVVSHPSYLHANGRRYVFISLEHVPTDTWVNEYTDEGRGLQKHGALLWKGKSKAVTDGRGPPASHDGPR
jgi:hypothetical protein